MSLTQGQRANLKTEVTTDPLARGYSGMASSFLLENLQAINRTRNKVSLNPSEVYQNIDQGDWAALTASQQDEVWNTLHLGDPLDPFGREATRFIAIFGGGSATITALQALRVDNISRLEQIGISGTVTEHQINRARS